LKYNKAHTLYSAESALKNGAAHCLEGVFVAAALLEPHGYEPLVLSFESQDGLDHTLFIFRKNRLWGALGKSRDYGLCGRLPQYRSLESLVRSYFDPYIDKTGKITAWQIAHLDEVAVDWRRGKENVWKLENHLLTIQHHPLTSSKKYYQKLLQRYLKKGPLPRRKNWL